MTLSLTIQDLRKELLKNCQYAIDLLDTTMRYVPTGYTIALNVAHQEGQGPCETSSMTGDSNYTITDEEIVQNFMILTHGVLIQEWEHFLYGILAEGVIYYLNCYNLRTPSFKINFKDLKQTKSIDELYKNISSESIKSLQGYDELFEQSRRLFKMKEIDSTLFKKMKKQIQIRHVFQHNRGKIRNDDIKEIKDQCFEIVGRGQCFEVVDDDGKLINFGVGDNVLLSRKEIQNLFETIEKYSEAFLIQAKSVVLVT